MYDMEDTRMLVPNKNQYDALKFAAVLLETQLENN